MKTEAPPKFLRLTNALWLPGRILFAIAMVALGFETIVCARAEGHFFGPGPAVIPCLPWLPAIPMVAGIAGSVWAICGMSLFVPRSSLPGRVLGTVLVLCTLVTILPKYLMEPGDVFLRTALFEPLALGGIALLQSGRRTMPPWLVFLSRFLLGASLVVFGLNLYLAQDGAAAFLPAMMPFRVTSIEIYAGAFVLGGLCVFAGLLRRWFPAVLGFLFGALALAVFVPRVLGFYSIEDVQNPNEWSNFLVAIGLCGGMWTLVRGQPQAKTMRERPVYAGHVNDESRHRLS